MARTFGDEDLRVRQQPGAGGQHDYAVTGPGRAGARWPSLPGTVVYLDGRDETDGRRRGRWPATERRKLHTVRILLPYARKAWMSTPSRPLSRQAGAARRRQRLVSPL